MFDGLTLQKMPHNLVEVTSLAHTAVELVLHCPAPHRVDMIRIATMGVAALVLSRRLKASGHSVAPSCSTKVVKETRKARIGESV